jgi:hypothetical protein
VSQPKTKHTAATKKAKLVKKAVRTEKPASRPTADRANKKSEVIALMKARQRRNTGRDHGCHQVASAHRAGLRQHPGQQRRGDGRVVEVRRGRAGLQDYEVSTPSNRPWVALLDESEFANEFKTSLPRSPRPGRRSCFYGTLGRPAPTK